MYWMKTKEKRRKFILKRSVFNSNSTHSSGVHIHFRWHLAFSRITEKIRMKLFSWVVCKTLYILSLAVCSFAPLHICWMSDKIKAYSTFCIPFDESGKWLLNLSNYHNVVFTRSISGWTILITSTVYFKFIFFLSKVILVANSISLDGNEETTSSRIASVSCQKVIKDIFICAFDKWLFFLGYNFSIICKCYCKQWPCQIQILFDALPFSFSSLFQTHGNLPPTLYDKQKGKRLFQQRNSETNHSNIMLFGEFAIKKKEKHIQNVFAR